MKNVAEKYKFKNIEEQLTDQFIWGCGHSDVPKSLLTVIHLN